MLQLEAPRLFKFRLDMSVTRKKKKSVVKLDLDQETETQEEFVDQPWPSSITGGNLWLRPRSATCTLLNERLRGEYPLVPKVLQGMLQTLSAAMLPCMFPALTVGL